MMLVVVPLESMQYGHDSRYVIDFDLAHILRGLLGSVEEIEQKYMY